MNQDKFYEVVIVGGGPGGIAAAIWACDLGLSTAIIDENREFGGQMLRVHNPITNYPGRSAANGRELRDHFLETMNSFAPVTMLRQRVIKADLTRKRIHTENGEVLGCTVIILATGVRRRRLDVPGEDDFVGRGILESGVGQKETCTGKTVLIVGGGDAALENASILSEYAAKIYLVHRREELAARQEFVDAAKANPKVELKLGSEVKEFSGGRALEIVSVESVDTGEIENLKVDAALVRIGVEPNARLFTDNRGLDSNGYINVDRYCQTCIDGVYAVGDVANPQSPTIVTAAGMGAAAAKSAYDLIYRKQRL